MSAPPVDIAIESPAGFDPIQILVRFVVAIALGFLGVTTGWLGCALYLVLPALAAVYISSRGSDEYMREVAPSISRVLSWLIAFHAYMLLVIDRPRAVRVTIHASGRPTLHTALLRLLTSLPAALVLAVLLVPACLFVVIGVVTILVTRSQSAPLLRYQRALVCYAGRLGAYHACIVDAYPQFTMHDSDGARDMQSLAS